MIKSLFFCRFLWKGLLSTNTQHCGGSNKTSSCESSKSTAAYQQWALHVLRLSVTMPPRIICYKKTQGLTKQWMIILHTKLGSSCRRSMINLTCVDYRWRDMKHQWAKKKVYVILGDKLTSWKWGGSNKQSEILMKMCKAPKNNNE